MDSLTQITLGAAVGEAVLGKKVGNRAMLWGGIAGTIPDLDVLSNFFMKEIDALAFHRGITHSLLFAVLAPPLFAWLVHSLYKNNFHNRKGFKIGGAVFWMGFYISMVVAVSAFGIIAGETDTLNFRTLFIGLGLGIIPAAFLYFNYYKRDFGAVEASWRDWTWLFFWATITHPMLDCCTAYGTQIFQPFWDYRVAFNNVAVADPAYTLPFLLCVLIAWYLTRASKWRRYVTWFGLTISTLYLLFGFYNKIRVDRVFEDSLKAQNIQYERFTTSPTIFNNFLWQGVAEGDTAYYHGMYSIMDKEKYISNFKILDKNHELIEAITDDHSIKILKWFSNGYYNLTEKPDGSLEFNDLRYGTLDALVPGEGNYIFKFSIKEKDGEIDVHHIRERPPATDDTFSNYWNRIIGRKDKVRPL